MIFCTFLVFTIQLEGQTTLYLDNFTGENDKGNIGGTIDVTGVDWSIDTSSGSFTASSDYFAVQSEQFEAQDVDGNVIFTSETFSISGYVDLQFSIDAGANGDFEASGDIYEVRVYIDGSPQLLYQGVVDEDEPGDPMFFGATQLSSTLQTFATSVSGTGTNAYVEITVNNNAGSEQYFFDNLQVQGTPSTTWTGSSGTDWGTSGNWSDGVPDSSTNATIPDVANAPIISGTTGAEVNDLTITETDGVTISSGGSLRVSGTSSGNLTYNRNIGTTNWYLVSSPFEGQTIVDFYTNESPALGSGTGNAQNVAIAPYDNSQSLAANRWAYYTEGQVDGEDGDDTTDTFTSGKGFTIKMQSTGDVSFTGTMSTSDVGIAITDGSGSGGNAFNLVGNPYPSYLAANTNADGTNNLLSINSGDLTEQTMWLWNQSLGTYETYNQASPSFHIAPGQGFFVSSSGSNTFNFTEAMQSHQGTDTFRTTDPNTRPEIELGITDGTDSRKADIFYIDGTTTSFDNGFDSSIFGGVANEFAVYTHAVANGTGRNLGIQSLPNSDFENLVIPVGVKASSGDEITISATSLNLPDNINVYLEDKTDNSFTILDSSSNFVTTLTEDLDGIGRFYLHTKTEVLSVDDLDLSNISIYKSDENNIRIVGVQNGNAQVSIYSILGKQVLNTTFEGNGVNDVTLPSLRTGVYIIQLATETGKLNKKVIIE